MLSSMAPTSDDVPQRGYFGPPPGELGPIGFESGPEPEAPKAQNITGPDGKPLQVATLAPSADAVDGPVDGDEAKADTKPKR